MLASRTALKEALDAHRLGQLSVAETRYRAILDSTATPTPLRSDTHHWLGVLQLQQAQPRDALQQFEQALTLNPQHDAARLNLGHAWQQLEDSESARAAFALAAQSVHQDVACAALSALGQSFAFAGLPDDALACFDKALALHPKDPALHDYRGAVLLSLHRHQAAIDAHRTALSLQPQRAGFHNNLGLAVKASGDLEEANWHFRDALRVDPSFVPALINLGQSVALSGDYDQASAPLHRAVTVAPQFPPAHIELANVLAAMQRYPEAASHYQQALELDPALTLAWQNLGAVRFEMGDEPGAVQALRHALTRQPTLALARFNLASLTLSALGRDAATKQSTASAAPKSVTEIADVGKDPSHNDARQAWEDYEARLTVWPAPLAPLGLPRWTGDFPLAERTILVQAEQGYGDTLQFVRFLGRLAKQAAHVVLEVQVPLQPLLADTAAIRQAGIEVIARGAALPAHIHCHIPLLSLPSALRSGVVPGDEAWAVPYIDQGNGWNAGQGKRDVKSDVNKRAAKIPLAARLPWARKKRKAALSREMLEPLAPLAALMDRARSTRHAAPTVKIGLAWSGNKRDPAHRVSSSATNGLIADKRAIPLDLLTTLFDLPHIEWHILQTDIDASDRDVLNSVLAQMQEEDAASIRIVDHSGALAHFGETATIIDGLDHVISVDTAVAHLAGAMACPSTVLLPFAADWRWSAANASATSLWYPSTKLLKQRERGNWSDVIERLLAALRSSGR